MTRFLLACVASLLALHVWAQGSNTTVKIIVPFTPGTGMDTIARTVQPRLAEKLGMPVVVVTNSQTGEVVRQIPNEVVVRVAHNLEAFKGMLHNAVV